MEYRHNTSPSPKRLNVQIVLMAVFLDRKQVYPTDYLEHLKSVNSALYTVTLN